MGFSCLSFAEVVTELLSWGTLVLFRFALARVPGVGVVYAVLATLKAFFFRNNILGLHTALVPQDGLLFNLTRNLIMVQNNNVHFILTKTYRSMFTMNEKEINIENIIIDII